MKEPIWTPLAERVQQANLTRFMALVNERQGTGFESYEQLYHWSVSNIPAFWEAMWEFGGVISSQGYDQVVDDLSRMPGAAWFPGARLNFAENLLRYRRADRNHLQARGR